jgi:hypothetical protein
MKHLVAAFALFLGSPAGAQMLVWDHGQYPPFQQLVQSLSAGQHLESMYVEDKTPVYALQRFAIDGTSATASDWTEAVEVLNTMRKAEPPTPAAWYARFQKQGSQCPSKWTLITEDKQSVTFERDSQACPPQPAQAGLYRVIYGKKQVFALIYTNKKTLTAEQRAQVLAMLASASIE